MLCSSDFGEDFGGGFGLFVGLGVVVPVVGPFFDGVDEVVEAVKAGTRELFVGEFFEPAFDQVRP